MSYFLTEGVIYGVTEDGTRTQIGSFRMNGYNLNYLQCFKLGYPIVIANNRLLFLVHKYENDTCKVEIFNERGEKLMEKVLEHASRIIDVQEERNVLFIIYSDGVHALGIRNAKHLGKFEYWMNEESSCVQAVNYDGTVVTLYDCARNKYLGEK